MKTRNKSESKKPNSSLASSISSFYTKMFAQWLSIILVTIFILVIGFSVFSMYYETLPSINALEAQTSLVGLVDTIESNNDSLFSLINADGQIIAISNKLISENIDVYDIAYIGAQINNKRVYVSL